MEAAHSDVSLLSRDQVTCAPPCLCWTRLSRTRVLDPSRRYLPIIYATGITVLERIGVNPAVCQRIVRLTNAPPIVSFLAASILLIQRVHSIYDRNLMVTVPL